MPCVEDKAIHQRIDAFDGQLRAALGQTRVFGRGQYRGMAEYVLDLNQIDADFDQMGCIAMPQAVRGDVFFIPHAATTRRSATCTPPRSNAVVAVAAARTPP